MVSLIRQGRWPRVRAALAHEAIHFCLITGLHGYKYIVQAGKHRIERLFWTLVVGLSMISVLTLMHVAYVFNRTHQSLLAVDTTHWPVWDVEVPAVTVCPGNKVLRSEALKLVATLRLPNGVDRLTVFRDMKLLIELFNPKGVEKDSLQRLEHVLNFNKLNVDSVLKKVTPTCDQLLERCVWKRRECLRCSNIFRLVRTGLGYCCSFNYMDRDHRTHSPPQRGCVDVSHKEVQRISACGWTNGLSVVARIDPAEYYSSSIASFSHLVLIHSPWVYPDENSQMYLVGAKTLNFVAYNAQLTQSMERVRTTLAPHKRKCVFHEEMYLPMFSIYTYTNCMASCRANFTLDACGCLPFTYPPIANTTTCTLKDVSCLASLKLPLVSLWTTSNTRHNKSIPHCPRCKPLCSHVDFEVEISTGELEWNNLSHVDSLLEGLEDEMKYAVFHVFPEDLVTTRYKLSLYRTIEDLLSTYGGLSGLLVGFSLVSGFELVYFFTIRLFFKLRKLPTKNIHHDFR